MLRRSADKRVGNRQAWRSLIESGDTVEPVTSVVLFYLSTWDGTGVVDRGLGRDAAIQKQHVGDTTDFCFVTEEYSLLFELNHEGPRREEDMFTAVGGVLLFTDFSRACAQQWVRTHGRRFACYKQRADTGSKAPKRQRHRPTDHTDKAVQARARAAYARLREHATDDTDAVASTAGRHTETSRQTVLGVNLRTLVASLARQPAPGVGKKTLRFRADTARKLAAKTATNCWSGCVSGALSRNLGGTLAVEAAKSGATIGVQARRWKLRKACRNLKGARCHLRCFDAWSLREGCSNPARRGKINCQSCQYDRQCFDTWSVGPCSIELDEESRRQCADTCSAASIELEEEDRQCFDT